MSKWLKRAKTSIRGDRLITGGASKLVQRFRDANADMIRRAIRGIGPHARDNNPGKTGGMVAVVNMSAAHVPAVCSGNPYLNGYDLARRGIIQAKDDRHPRVRIDKLLALVANQIVLISWGLTNSPIQEQEQEHEHIYYAAVELNGSGIRFFGDICLVLKQEAIDGPSFVIDRNSYDLIVPPIWQHIKGKQPGLQNRAARRFLKNWSGKWPDDVPDMAVCKVLNDTMFNHRRLTTGNISDGVLMDEDYMEIIKFGSFSRDEIAEIRLSASDVAAETHIGERLNQGPAPDAAEILWRHHRRSTVQAARKAGIQVRIVTHTGRGKG